MSFSLRQTSETSFMAANGEAIEFRLEVFERDEAVAGGSRFRVRVWVRELVRVPLITLGSAGGDYTDDTVLVISDSLDGFEHHGGTADSAADACMTLMRERLGVQ